MRRRVIALSVAPAVAAYRRPHRLELRLAGRAPDRRYAAVELAHLGHVHAPAAADDLTHVGDLSARLGVERRLLQHHRHLPVLKRLDGGHERLDLDLVVAHERALGGATVGSAPGREIAQFVGPDGQLARLPVLLRHLALTAERPLEARDLHAIAALDRHELGEIDRETERVVELEGVLTADRPTKRGGTLRRTGGRELLEPRQAALDRRKETLLLGPRRLDYVLSPRREFGELRAHHVEHLLHHRHERRLATAQEPRMAHGATQDPAQHVPAPLVAREDAVGEQEAHGARMIGEHAVARRVGVPVGVRLVDDLPHHVEQRLEEVGVVVVGDALHHGRDPFESRAGVDRGLRERLQHAVRLPVELHEDEVPDFEEAPCLRTFHERVERELLSLAIGPLSGRPGGELEVLRHVREVDVDLGARAAGTGVGHLPEVVLLAETVDAARGDPSDVAPEPPRFVVVLVDGDADMLDGDLQVLGDELPGEADRVALEVVAEREVAEHLEEGVMPGGVPHLLEVVVLAAGANAFLRCRRPVIAVGRRFLTKEDLLELHHPRVGEQQGRVVAGDQGRRGTHRMLLAGEIGEESAPDFISAHIVAS